ncbi:MFS transporter [Saccharothrix hoggarensis]|uniref:MFS transporter n=1 Tax=Saccharothrix hoggarensis TaxID=913853 RepID=A0ABW3R199_9PSEU
MTIDQERIATAVEPGLSVRTIQRRVIWSLIVVQAVIALVFAMTGPLLTLIAERVTGSAGQAGLAQAMIYCGGMAFALPLAVLSVRLGRRAGIAAGYLGGSLGCGLVVLGAVLSSYAVILAGSVLIGGAIAAGMQARFAATDLAESGTLGRSMGVLSWSSIVGAVVGPALLGVLSGIGAGWLPEYTGPYLAIAASLALSGTLVLVLLRPDPLLLAQRLHRQKAPTEKKPKFRTALAAVLRHQGARRAIIALMIVHAAMISLMNMASIHMSHGAATLGAIGLAIGVHTAAMFLPGPLVGWLTDRVGVYPVLLTGLALEAAAAVVLMLAPMDDTVLIGLGLLLLGLGWSPGYLAGSVLLTESTEGPTRTLAQGASDLLVQLTAAVGALVAGIIVTTWSYTALAAGWAVVVFALLFWLAGAARAARTSKASVPSPASPRD